MLSSCYPPHVKQLLSPHVKQLLSLHHQISLEDTTLINSWVGDMPPLQSPPPIPDYLPPNVSSEDLGIGDFSSIHLTSKPSSAFSSPSSSHMNNRVARGILSTSSQNKTSSPILPKVSLPDLRVKSPSPVMGRSLYHSDSTNSFEDDSFEASLA